MKKLFIVLLLILFLLPLTSCQSKEKTSDPVNTAQDENQSQAQTEIVALADLPDTKNMTFTIDGKEESVPVSKALHDNFYAMYYDPDGFTFVPGEVLDTGFSDAFISLYDDETTMVLTTMKVCYTADSTPEQWIESTPGTEWAPQTDVTSALEPNWEPLEQTAALGEENQKFKIWTTDESTGVTNLCYTTSFRDGCLAVIVSYPDEAADGWGARMDRMVQTLILASA